jgi:L-ascorbate metabolism protein UlaG (beta-lactamase superfamily)
VSSTFEENTMTYEQLRIPERGGSADLKEGSVFFVGTATVILRYAGFTILTDPNFLHRGDHVHLGYGLTARRRTEPAIDIDQLPDIDFVLLSHLHGDHFDQVAEERLDRQVPILTNPQAAASLRRKGFVAARGITTWDTVEVRKGTTSVEVTALPGRHGPGPIDALLPDVMCSLLEFADASGWPRLRMYVSGDTLVHEELAEIPRRHPGIDLALLHLGGTRILGVLLTMDARQGLEAMRIVAPRMTVPIHYNDYGVFRSPLEDFAQAVRAAGVEDHVTYLAHGESYVFRPDELRRLTTVQVPVGARPAARPRILPAAVRGAAAGAAATIPMTATMAVIQRALPGHQQYRLPPEELPAAVSDRARAPVGARRTLDKGGWIVPHVAYGAAAGGALALLARYRRPSIAGGIAFGLGIWAASYLGWIPALRLPHAATDEPAGRNVMMAAAHVVWGAAAAGLLAPTSQARR